MVTTTITNAILKSPFMEKTATNGQVYLQGQILVDGDFYTITAFDEMVPRVQSLELNQGDTIDTMIARPKPWSKKLDTGHFINGVNYKLEIISGVKKRELKDVKPLAV